MGAGAKILLSKVYRTKVLLKLLRHAVSTQSVFWPWALQWPSPDQVSRLSPSFSSLAYFWSSWLLGALFTKQDEYFPFLAYLDCRMPTASQTKWISEDTFCWHKHFCELENSFLFKIWSSVWNLLVIGVAEILNFKRCTVCKEPNSAAKSSPI